MELPPSNISTRQTEVAFRPVGLIAGLPAWSGGNMNRRFMIVFAFALAVSAAASFFLYRLIVQRLSARAETVSTQVVAATRDLVIGTLVADADVTLMDWKGQIPPRTIVKKEDVVGRGVIATIYAGEPVFDTRLAPKGAGAGLAATIPVGKRAVAVRVNEIIGVAGFATPGMRVDVVALGQAPNTSIQLGTLSKTLLQNIEVLSAGQQIEKDAQGKPVSVQVVNLLVTPDEAEIISLASNNARIQLVLRNPLDTEEAKTKGTAMAKIFAMQAAPAKPVPGARRTTQPAPAPVPVAAPKREPVVIVVEVLNGSQRTQTKFDEKQAAP